MKNSFIVVNTIYNTDKLFPQFRNKKEIFFVCLKNIFFLNRLKNNTLNRSFAIKKVLYFNNGLLINNYKLLYLNHLRFVRISTIQWIKKTYFTNIYLFLKNKYFFSELVFKNFLTLNLNRYSLFFYRYFFFFFKNI